ncbi:amidohydrolase family protein [Paraglaciecola arctica]|uniref:amidohydrolase family protein n=1 Tax=Paraglaciecola arctica TaxID=1128911 RepID=UPI001C06F7FB|nr:amidohydrolase family protein [Paraglaciecola arctica]MBU3004637.1 amidohydrolase [Paraglaciecola arctica]
MKAISADSHVVEAPEVFAGLVEKFGDEAPRYVSIPGGGDSIMIPSIGDAGSNIAFMSIAGARLDRKEPLERRRGHKPKAGKLTDPEIINYIKGGYDVIRDGLKDGSKRGECQDADGVVAEFLYPGFFSMFKTPNLDLLVALERNYNDWLKDYCNNSNGRLYGLAALPIQNPAAAVEEFKRVLKLGYKGVIIPSNAPSGTHYYDKIYDPIWALAEESGTPISMHVACFSETPPWVIQASQRDKLAIYGNSASLIHETLIDLMVRGVCKRFPNLKFVLAEFNAGWIAHFLDRVDQAWQREYGVNPLSIEYEDVVFDTWRRQFYATIEDDQPALSTRNIIGEDNLLWGSDYPHADSTFPCSAKVLDEMFENYSPELRQKITHDNVKKLYGI